jgi:hypothetical protein
MSNDSSSDWYIKVEYAELRDIRRQIKAIGDYANSACRMLLQYKRIPKKSGYVYGSLLHIKEFTEQIEKDIKEWYDKQETR